MNQFYRIEMIVAVHDTAPNPRKWIVDAVNQCLEPGEDIIDWSVEPVGSDTLLSDTE